MGGSFYYNCHYATSDLDLNPRALHHIAASRTLAVITSSRSLTVSVKGLARSLALSSRPRSHTHAVIIGVHRRCGDVGQHLPLHLLEGLILTTQNIRAAVIRVFVLCGGVLMHSELRSHPRGAPALVTPAHYIAVLSELEAPCISKMEAQTAESQGMSILCSLQCTRRSAATHNQNQL